MTSLLPTSHEPRAMPARSVYTVLCDIGTSSNHFQKISYVIETFYFFVVQYDDMNDRYHDLMHPLQLLLHFDELKYDLMNRG